MKSTKWIIAGVVAIALTFQLARNLGPVGGESGGSSDEKKSSTGDSSSGMGYVDPGEGTPTKSSRSEGSKIRSSPKDDFDPGPPVYLTAGRELAKVNGVILTLKDLMPLPDEPVETEHVMTTVRYEFLLNRAVERELTFQEAESQGLKLDETQIRALEEAAERRRTEMAGKVVFDDLGDNPRNADFQQRDFAALLLQNSLAQKSGVTSPNVGSEHVRTYYEAHINEFPPLPTEATQRETAWRKVESTIRVKLAPALRQEHQEQLARFMEGLKEAAEISTASL